jgi:glyoxylase-like metal-dependent hydrolase (beta-lactamase superfamily II)
MNKVKVLIEGYAKVNKDGTWDATSSATLIDIGKLKIIVDPGCNRKLLLEALAKENLKTRDIDYVFVTHYHPDHCLLMGIFENAVNYDSVQWQKGSVGGDVKNDLLPDTDIKIIKTPGHSSEHSSLLVNTENGKILIGGDVFWWAEGEDQEVDVNKHDDFASDLSTLKFSRSQVLEMADFIIPGHGKMFKNPKK